MKHGSLFSGIGGFDLAAEWMGWENVFHCEWMEFPRKVLDYYWPDADSHIDICKTDFKKYANRIDILTGGFPCQPFSLAGKRKGTDDERYLCLDLETEGYEVQPFIIPAAAKNAPHRRDRCWFIAQNTNQNGWRSDQRKEKPNIGKFGNTCAGNNERLCLPKGNAADTKCARLEYGNQTGNIRTKKRTSCSKGSKSSYAITTNGSVKRNATDTNGNGCNERNGNDEINTSERGINAQRNIEPGNDNGNAANTNGFRLRRKSDRIGNTKFNSKDNAPNDWQNFPTQPPVCGGDDGLPTELDGITFSKWRNESIKGYGNAIVPQIAYQLFQIIEHENKNKTTQETKQQDIIPCIGN